MSPAMLGLVVLREADDVVDAKLGGGVGRA
jgi:hypothetical protein